MIRDVAIDAGCKESHCSQHGMQGTWRTWRKLCDDRVSLQKIAMQAIGASDSTEVCTTSPGRQDFLVLAKDLWCRPPYMCEEKGRFTGHQHCIVPPFAFLLLYIESRAYLTKVHGGHPIRLAIWNCGGDTNVLQRQRCCEA